VAKKKKSASRKPAAKRARTRKSAKATADTSRLDTGPLQEHIKKRIKELEGQAAKGARQDDGTLERLKMALETIEDICFPTMTVPI
jgi:hypothetical protein